MTQGWTLVCIERAHGVLARDARALRHALVRGHAVVAVETQYLLMHSVIIANLLTSHSSSRIYHARAARVEQHLQRLDELEAHEVVPRARHRVQAHELQVAVHEAHMRVLLSGVVRVAYRATHRVSRSRPCDRGCGC